MAELEPEVAPIDQKQHGRQKGNELLRFPPARHNHALDVV
jgi:hypothetical protein